MKYLLMALSVTLAGAFIFKEKLSKTQLLGILLGLVAIVIVGCGEFFRKIIF